MVNICVQVMSSGYNSWTAYLIRCPIVAVLQLATMTFVAIVHKWLLLQSITVGAAGSHQLDSRFMNCYSICNGVWMLALQYLDFVTGTPLFAFIFSVMGAKVTSLLKDCCSSGPISAVCCLCVS